MVRIILFILFFALQSFAVVGSDSVWCRTLHFTGGMTHGTLNDTILVGCKGTVFYRTIAEILAGAGGLDSVRAAGKSDTTGGALRLGGKTKTYFDTVGNGSLAASLGAKRDTSAHDTTGHGAKVGGSGTAGYVPYWTGTNTQAASAIHFGTLNSDAFNFDTNTNRFSLTGPVRTLLKMPIMDYRFTGDADAALSYFMYDHDNLGIVFDAYHNGTIWTSSSASGNFALYKIGGCLFMAYQNGIAKGSSFPVGTWNTSGAVFGSNGYLGIGGAIPTLAYLEGAGSNSMPTIKAGNMELQSYSIGQNWITDNITYNGGWKYRVSGYGEAIYLGAAAGAIHVYMFPSGSAGAAATPVEALGITNTGVVTIPHLTPAGIVTNDASGNLGTSKAITGIDSIRIIDGTYDTLVIGAGGKKWKFLPIGNQ